MQLFPTLVHVSKVKEADLRVPFVLRGYRLSPTVFQSLVSVFQLHTETLNIWSHFLPLVVFAYYLARGPRDASGLGPMDIRFYAVHCIGCCVMFAASALYHCFQSVSQSAHDALLRFDFAGIGVMIACEMYAGIGLGLGCVPAAQRVYLAVAGCFAMLMLGAPFYPSRWRNACFIGATAWGLAPLVHFFAATEAADAMRVGMPFAATLLLYGGGFFFYHTRLPESVAPKSGTFDIFGKSHTVWHLFIASAAAMMHRGVVQALESPIQCFPAGSLFTTLPLPAHLPPPPASWGVSTLRQRRSGAPGPPPRVDELDDGVIELFTRDGAAVLEAYFVDDSREGAGSHYKYSAKLIDPMVARARELRRTLAEGGFPFRASRMRKQAPIFEALEAHSFEGKDVAVVGSMDPWWEAVCVAYGARSVTTIEYNALDYVDSEGKIATTTPELWAAGTPAPRAFGAVLSISSIDHDGLGRYNDPIAPDGDLLSMWWTQRLMLRRDDPSAFLLLTVPIGPDAVAWNLHRRYGKMRLPLLLRGRQIKGRFGWSEARVEADAPYYRSYEPAFVLGLDEGAAALVQNEL